MGDLEMTLVCDDAQITLEHTHLVLNETDHYDLPETYVVRSSHSSVEGAIVAAESGHPSGWRDDCDCVELAHGNSGERLVVAEIVERTRSPYCDWSLCPSDVDIEGADDPTDPEGQDDRLTQAIRDAGYVLLPDDGRGCDGCDWLWCRIL